MLVAAATSLNVIRGEARLKAQITSSPRANEPMQSRSLMRPSVISVSGPDRNARTAMAARPLRFGGVPTATAGPARDLKSRPRRVESLVTVSMLPLLLEQQGLSRSREPDKPVPRTRLLLPKGALSASMLWCALRERMCAQATAGERCEIALS